MPPKKALPAPIDRPLSRAYLREFAGWSTAYPPGQSEPTSLRRMENAMVNRDGSLRIRPGLRYLSYDDQPTESTPGTAYDKEIVGTHEAFYLNDGSKAYLFAVREDDDTVGFRVLSFAGSGTTVYELTDAGIDFAIPQGEAAINFTAATTYVKYLQIDNKIFALSNAGETLRLFYVGATKSVRKILSIERPNFSIADKLTVMHPDATWIEGAKGDIVRENLLRNPAGVGLDGWTADVNTILTNTVSPVKSGTSALKINSKPTRKNMMPQPLHNVALYGIGDWIASSPAPLELTESGSYLKLEDGTGSANRYKYAFWDGPGSTIPDVEAGQQYSVAVDFGALHDSVDAAINIRWYTAAGVQIGTDTDYTSPDESTRIIWGPFTAPEGAARMRVRVGMKIKTSSSHYATFKNVHVGKYGESTDIFSGDLGGDYAWEGTVNNSASIYHPPVDAYIESNKAPISALASVVAAAELRTEQAAGVASVGLRWYDALGAIVSTVWAANTAIDNTSWDRVSKVAAAPAGATHVAAMIWFDNVPKNIDYYFDEGLLEVAGALDTYFDGDTAPASMITYSWRGTAHESTSIKRLFTVVQGPPTPETPTAKTLVAAPDDDDEFALGVFYNFAFFYTFENEIGETAASQVTNIKTQRGWNSWRWESPNAEGEPSGTPVVDPVDAADQLVAVMPEDVFNHGVAQDAKAWNLYMLTWSSQSVVPVTGVLVAKVDLTNTPDYDKHGWAQVTPEALNLQQDKIVPNLSNLRNYSDPSRGGQGLVAADRMILVKDPTDQAVIRWTSNEQGDYINFTADRGGGYKTLTSGNLYVPSAVKLWQNPQSADTITILCVGTDGHSAAYYMAPAEVTSQSDATPIMGFEETTATPGTTSPYGCEVFNNSLYHPVDEQLMKSTASNYNINHKSMTDQIEDRWQRLQRKDRIVSSLHDSRLYYIVNNPRGEEVEDGCWGNEIWVFDGAAENGHWSRWKIQALSLRKIEQGGKIYMSVIRPDGIYYLDPLYEMDDFVNDEGEIEHRYIPWYIETNTQGANRAHDAWCHLQQLDINLGNFQGCMQYGIRSHDVNGKDVRKVKQITDANPPDLDYDLPFDIHDQLLVKKDLQEWFFFAGSCFEDDGVTVKKSFGQINNVQYRYAPVSVNVGYEYGSIETFEYGRDLVGASSNTDAGVPQPFNDRRRP